MEVEAPLPLSEDDDADEHERRSERRERAEYQHTQADWPSSGVVHEHKSYTKLRPIRATRGLSALGMGGVKVGK